MTGTDPTLWPADDAAAGLAVSVTGPLAGATLDRQLAALVSDRVASRISGGDPSLWRQEADTSGRFGWVDLPDSSRPLVDRIAGLRAELLAEGVDRVVLCGPDGSTLAASAIAASFEVELTVLEGTEPVTAVAAELARSVVVVAGGGWPAFEAAFGAAEVEAGRRMVAVTDPGSALERAALAGGYRAVFHTDPAAGERFCALTAFGLVPAGLAGADLGALLDEAAAVGDLLAEDADTNPALVLGAVLSGSRSTRSAGAASRGRVDLLDEDCGLPGFVDWVAHVTLDTGTPPAEQDTGDVLSVRLLPVGALEDGSNDDAGPRTGARSSTAVSVAGPLGAQFLLWEYAICVADRLLGINPFEEPVLAGGPLD